MSNFHWMIMASDELKPVKTGGSVMHWAVDITIRHVSSEEEAITKAKEIIKRKHYKLRWVAECECAAHNLHQRNIREISQEQMKLLKKQLGNE